MEPIITEITNNRDRYGKEIFDCIDRLFPICRSITGNGVRQSLSILQKIIPLKLHEVPSGEKVFDWSIPKEWNIRDAYIIDPDGNKIVDFSEQNLHVLNYSIPVDQKVSLEELKKHLYTLPDQPDVIPYRTSYYKEIWGFCIEYSKFQKLKPGNYHVYIDSSLEKGSLTYGEYYIPGKMKDEVLVSTHICHPSMCNDNLSGMGVVSFLARELSRLDTRYSYRFLFVPATIGSIAWLSLNEDKTNNIKHGLVASLLGDSADFTYKKSRRANAEIDRIAAYAMQQLPGSNKIIDFFPYGYDERQYCSPGFNLPVGALSRSEYGSFPEYHTSADNKDLIKAEKLTDALLAFVKIFQILEANNLYMNTNPKCEPQLGKRGLYDKIGGSNESKTLQMASLWVLNQSDGKHDLLDIAEKSGISFELIVEATKQLIACELLEPLTE